MNTKIGNAEFWGAQATRVLAMAARLANLRIGFSGTKSFGGPPNATRQRRALPRVLPARHRV
jgi:hypothetical protein